MNPFDVAIEMLLWLEISADVESDVSDDCIRVMLPKSCSQEAEKAINSYLGELTNDCDYFYGIGKQIAVYQFETYSVIVTRE